MNQHINLRTILASLFFAALNSLVIAGIAELAIGFWGRPRGVAFGLLGFYYWIGLSIIGLATVTIFRVLPIRYALLGSISIITILTAWLWPSYGERAFISVYIAAVSMCLLLGLWKSLSNRHHG